MSGTCTTDVHSLPRGTDTPRPVDVGRPYELHCPEQTVLYRILQAHWKTFLRDLESAAEPPALPAFVVSEVEAFLRCGILAHGLILAKCRDCGRCRAVVLNPPPSGTPSRAFTMADLPVHEPDLGPFTMTDLRVHDAPI